MFCKGQEVICVDDSFIQEQIIRIPNRPVINRLYTIRDFYRQKGQPVVLLEELINPMLPANEGRNDGGQLMFEPTFKASRFAPLIPNSHIKEEILNAELVFI